MVSRLFSLRKWENQRHINRHRQTRLYTQTFHQIWFLLLLLLQKVEEMEMDMPDADELEWLAHQQDQYIPEEYEEDLDHFPPPAPSPPPPTSNEEVQSSTENIGCRKRLWSDDDHLNGDEASGKRKKTPHLEAGPELTMVDEEWLQYPPECVNLSPGDAVANQVPTVDESLPRRIATDIEGDCMPVTGPSGVRVYAKRNGTDFTSSSFPNSIADFARSSNGLLSESIHVLLERVEQQMFEQACRATTEGMNDENHFSSSTANEQLWVDKYAPKSFTELLSDEQTNREVLRWLKQWDPCVFGSKNTSTSSEVLSALRRHSLHSQNHRFSGNKGFSFKSNEGVQPRNVQDGVQKMNGFNHTMDNHSNISRHLKRDQTCDDRPDEKILLLCGPPGLGKTTLAHVTAKHCGYRVVEINASDDRSASTMEGKILDVVQMNSVTADSKPKCLVIDEIDGALGEGKGAVEVLLNMISSEKKLVSGKENDVSDTQSTKATKKKGPTKTSRLARPVICICNDLFVPALRSLRQVARVHTFVQPNTSRVVNRLKYICNKEGFRTSAQGLTALAEYTACDIRACLNTLQFLKNKNQTLNVVDVSSQVVGRKDMTSSIFDIWREVLQKRKPKVKVIALDSCEQGTEDFARLHNLISNHGDYELAAEGIHENFLHVRYHDSAMEKTVKCLDFLCELDLLRHGTQLFSLYAYQPSIIVAIRRLIAQVEKPNIEWPKSFQRYRAILTERKDSLKSWLNSISPTVSRYLSLNSIAQDVVSSLLYILSPPSLRPVASQLLSEKEREEINQLVDIMIDYAVTYKKAKALPPYGSHGQDVTSDTLGLCFDPPINDFVKFKDYKSGHSLLSLAMRQILTHEVEKQRILRESTARTSRVNKAIIMQQGASITEDVEAHASQANLDVSLGESSSMVTLNEVELKKHMTSVTNISNSSGLTKATLRSNVIAPAVSSKAKLIEDARKPSGVFNFFDRFKRPSQKGFESTENSPGRLLTSLRDSRPLLFKFNEGFTNAVKRPVRLGELL